MLGPEVVVKPSAMLCPAEYKEVFPTPEQVKIGKKASLVIEGSGKLTIKSLKLDGAMHIVCEEGANAVIQELWVQNDGWVRVNAKEDATEVIKMRGYELEKKDTAECVYKNQGDCTIL